MKKLKLNHDIRSTLKSRCIIAIAAMVHFLFSINTPVMAATPTKAPAANTIQGSTLGSGLINMTNDATTFLLILSPIVGALFALYFLIRKNAADEQDQKQWNKRLINTGICTVGAVLVTALITLVTGYFK
jgi:phosphate/sulfate permease